jgi:hypothetical protein
MTNEARATFGGSYATFIGSGLIVATVTAATASCFVGRDGWPAIAAGCAASWLASCVGAAPVALGVATAPQNAANAVLAGTALRFIVVLALAAPLLLGNWFPRTTLVVCLGISYLLILLTDSLLAVRMIRRYTKVQG